MSAIFPSAVATQLQLLTALNNTKVTLNVNAGIGDTTITVDDASPLPASGYVTFADNEANPETIYYTGKSGNNLTGVTRGSDSTAAGTHVAGALLEQRWNADYHNILALEMVAIEQNLSDRIGVDSGSHYLKIVDGAVTTPSLTFASDADTGLYRIGANDVAIATGGTKALEVNGTQQVVIPKTTNQLILGVTNTVTISATAPTVSRVYTMADAGADASFVMTQGTQTIVGATTFSAGAIFSSTISAAGAVTITPTTNQLILGVTRTVTISAVQPASTSRTWTIPDITGNGTFAALEGTQTFSGAKTFSSTLTMSSATIAMGTNKITGLANGSASDDAAAYGQTPKGGGTITNWAAPSGHAMNGFGTLGNSHPFYRRVGDTMEFRWNFTSGTTAASTASMTLPTGVAIDYAKISNQQGAAIGWWFQTTNGTNTLASSAFVQGVVYCDGSTTGTVYFVYQVSANSFLQVNASTICGSSTNFAFYFSIPVTGWSI